MRTFFIQKKNCNEFFQIKNSNEKCEPFLDIINFQTNKYCSRKVAVFFSKQIQQFYWWSNADIYFYLRTRFIVILKNWLIFFILSLASEYKGLRIFFNQKCHFHKFLNWNLKCVSMKMLLLLSIGACVR